MNESKTFPIHIDTMEQARDFCALAARFHFDIDIRQGRYVVDAKSILGILSLNFSRPMVMDVYTDDTLDVEQTFYEFFSRSN